jgi:thiamine monophosphate kinase
LPESVRKGDTDYLRFMLEYAARVQSGDVEVVEAVASLCSLEDAQSQEVKHFCDSFSRLIATTFGGGASGKGMTVSQAALKDADLRRTLPRGYAGHGADVAARNEVGAAGVTLASVCARVPACHVCARHSVHGDVCTQSVAACRGRCRCGPAADRTPALLILL